MHSFHDTRKTLPPGCTTDNNSFGTGGGWGSSWMVFILPNIEQGPIFNQWLFNGSSGYTNANNRALSNGGLVGPPIVNGTVGIIFQVYRCPSSPLPRYAQNNGLQVMQPNYVGISGAANGLIPGYTESRIDNSAAGINCCSGAGPASGGGMLFRGSQVKLTDATDGTSNTMLASEHSDWMTASDGSKRQWTAGGLYGWSMGANTNTAPNNPAATGNDNRQFNCTTIRYALNQKTGWSTNGGTGTQSGDCTVGVCYDMGNNIPLNSTHPGGVNAVMTDGTVRFVNNSTPLNVLGQISVRDDGVPGSLD
jgi:hypothetical protein